MRCREMQVEASSLAETEVLVSQGDGYGGEVKAGGEVEATAEGRRRRRSESRRVATREKSRGEANRGGECRSV